MARERRHNLPAHPVKLIGREEEVTTVRQRLLGADRALLTLTGVGGCGKTSLALHVAYALTNDFPDGVWLVELASLAAPMFVVQAIAAALGVREGPGRTQAEALIAHLESRQLLLVLDNCEHLIDDAAHTAELLLTTCPDLRILATSREALRVRGEVTWPVPSLAVPHSQRRWSIDEVAASPAVQLFVERVQAVQPRFDLTPENATAVVHVCARLEGLPLALELAAARVAVLPVEELAERLDDTFRLLTEGSRTAPTRQQALSATLDWSHNLLNEAEQALFRRLGIFVGGWDLAAAEAVCPGDPIAKSAVLDLLSRLVSKSLVVAEARESQGRYRLLEPVRDYARARLERSGEAEAVQSRHGDVYLALAESAEAGMLGHDQGWWFDHLEREIGNIRAVLERSRTTPGQVERGLRLAGALWRFWDGRGHLGEGRTWLNDLLALSESADSTEGRARALFAAGWLAVMQESDEAAGTLPAESVALWRRLDNPRGLSVSLWLAALVERHRDPAAGLVLARECLSLARRLDDETLTTWALWVMGELLRTSGEVAQAVPYFEEVLALAKKADDRVGAAYALRSLAHAAWLQGDYARAAAHLRERLVLSLRVDDRWNIPDSLEGLGWVASARRQQVRAARLYGAGEAVREVSETTLLGERGLRRERRLAALRTALGDEAYAAAWAEGRAMSLDEAVAYALADDEQPTTAPESGQRRATPDRHPDTLTRREREVVALMARGHTDRQIAEVLSISVGTASVHVHHILEKLGLHSRWQVADWARAQGLAQAVPD